MKRTQLKRKKPLKRAKNAPRRVKSKETAQYLKKKLDAVFSQYIRIKYSRDGLVACFTCDTVYPIAQMQNGHYVSRQYNSLRFSELNCHPQCVSCNVFRHGNMDEYAVRLVKKYGTTILQTLAEEKRKIKQFTAQEYKDLIVIYENAKTNYRKEQ